MQRIIRISSDPHLYILGRRVHHGLTGSLMTIAGVLLIFHDRKDWPWPLNDPQEDAGPDV